LAGGAGTGGTTLLGRRTQCEALNQLLTDVMAGTSPVVTVLRGDAGVGKSALLGYVSHRVNGWQATTVGVDQRWNWPTSACINCAHRCWITSTGCPSHSERRSPRAFGLGVGAVSDRFLVGLATRSLFADIAEQQPLACRRHTMARPGLCADPRLRRPPPRCRADRAGVRSSLG
jgi:hypothetical protein